MRIEDVKAVIDVAICTQKRMGASQCFTITPKSLVVLIVHINSEQRYLSKIFKSQLQARLFETYFLLFSCLP